VSAANITSFTATPTQIEAGSTSNLTGYFTGGTGVITPGNIAATSGTLIPVTPTTTTTYTLTVTPTGGGTAATKTATVTVYPVPVISSFTASPNPIVAGTSSSLSANFSGGSGVITPGNVSVTSGTPVNVSPSVTTTYTLTVTPPVGSVAATQTVTVNVQTAITVDEASVGPVVNAPLLGMNMAVWYDFTAHASTIVNALQGAGIVALRWPGGSTSDDYHWNGGNANPANGVKPTPSTCPGTYQNPNTHYLNFINDLENAIPNGFDVALTADYGSNPACTGGGDPNEAANWVKYAYANSGTVSHVTVGNENYGSWEADLHTVPHDPTTYAAAVIGAGGYYSLIKAQSSNTLVGVVVDANCTSSSGCTNGWDSTVLSNAKGYYDFVEYHYYPQYGNVTSDTYLVHQAALDFTTNIKTIKSELTTAGESGTPIYVGEIGANSSNPGTQSWSITQGLYAGQLLGEAMNDGISRLTWWIGFGNCLGAGNNSSLLYGWQNTWGAYNVFSDADSGCPGEGAIGTMSPTAEAFNLFQNVAENGANSALTAGVNGDTTNVRAYAATHSGGGTALMLFNLSQTTSAPVTIALSGLSTSSDVTVITYSKAIYDLSQNNTWDLPTTNDLGAQALPLSLTLAPWSMNVVILKP